MNTIGSIPIFLSILARYPLPRQRGIIVRELFFALLILLIFMFFGDDVLRFLGITQSTMGVAGGIILFIIGLGLIFPKKSEGLNGERSEPFIVPLALPLIAGPGAITTVMIYGNQVDNDFLMCGVILLAWIPSVIILLFATSLKKILGQKGLNAIQRFGGMLLCLIAVQMISTGSIEKIKEAFPSSKQSSLSQQN
jgi:multiple antibiotic resistance protein